MREIKFRGKRIDNGEWVVGDYSRYSKEKSIIMVDLLEPEDYWVWSETIGQYTGLKDKYGVEIYEGDVLRGAMVNLIVAYKGAGFIAYWNDHDYGYGTEQMWCNLVEGGEVIGNIYDNPELLRVRE